MGKHHYGGVITSAGEPQARPARQLRLWLTKIIASLFLIHLLSLIYWSHGSLSWSSPGIHNHRNRPTQRQIDLYRAECHKIQTPAGPPASFLTSSRTETGSDRFVLGTSPTLIQNAKIWTGSRNGTEVVYGDLLMDQGVVIKIGYIPLALMKHREALSNKKIKVIDADGRWVTPGLVDLHSHIGVYSSPDLNGASDHNSNKGPILPWLRSLDGLNTHDESYALAMAGGVTSAQILPGSANNIGGQAFVIKLRPTSERSATSKLIEPPLGVSTANRTEYIPWRHMKHACGENPDRVYSQTRMDGQWNFRKAYNEARKIKELQDEFCGAVKAEDWNSPTIRNALEFGDGQHLKKRTGGFLEDLQWEALVDVLRGKVKLAIHCYEAVDLDGIVRLSNEFKFPVASFHHAGETYLVPDLLKKTWGGTPTIALFASNFKKKREAYRSSEFAPRILADHGIPVVMKSDHPVLNSRYLLFEAQQAFYYGLDPALALTSVTSTPARAAGLGHRIGMIGEGYDADVVLWDTHPLSLGATPVQVWVDGIAQLRHSASLRKPTELQRLPKVPNWDKEAVQAVEYDGTPPLRGRKRASDGPHRVRTKLLNVNSIHKIDEHGQVVSLLETPERVRWNPANRRETTGHTVIIEDGQLVCVESGISSCDALSGPPTNQSRDIEWEVVDLKGGSIAPGLTTYGSPLGLVEVRLEASTNDGIVLDPLAKTKTPKLIADAGLIRAVDGLMFEGRNTLLAYKSGVTRAITAPSADGLIQGVSATWSTGGTNSLEVGAVVQRQTAVHLHLSMGMASASVSTQVAALRALLMQDEHGRATEDELGAWGEVRRGSMPLVITVNSADIMATLIDLKRDYTTATGHPLMMTFAGATEAHLLADYIQQEDISVIITSPRPYPTTWEQRRILPGPPLSETSATIALINAGVNVAIGVVDEASARNTRFELAWAALESNGTMLEGQTIALATTNLDKALGLSKRDASMDDLVLYEGGGVLTFGSKVVGVVSPQRKLVELFP